LLIITWSIRSSTNVIGSFINQKCTIEA
jgi:hypothetical protein